MVALSSMTTTVLANATQIVVPVFVLLKSINIIVLY